MTRRGFSRSETPSFDRSCAALLPPSRTAIAHPLQVDLQVALDVFLAAGFGPRPESPHCWFTRADPRGVAHPADRVSTLLSPSAPFATRSFAARGFIRRARHQGRDCAARLSSEGQAPVHRVLHRPFGVDCVGELASLGQSRLSTSANETTAYGHVHEVASAPAARSCAPCEANGPQAFAPPATTPKRDGPCAARRIPYDRSGFAPDSEIGRAHV